MAAELAEVAAGLCSRRRWRRGSRRPGSRWSLLVRGGGPREKEEAALVRGGPREKEEAALVRGGPREKEEVRGRRRLRFCLLCTAGGGFVLVVAAAA